MAFLPAALLSPCFPTRPPDRLPALLGAALSAQEESGGSLPRFLLPFVARLGGMGGLRAPDRGEQAYQVRQPA